MYAKNETEGHVNSYLADGTAWDTTINWIAKDNVDVTKSSNYGNYNNADIKYTGVYAKHIWAQPKSPNTTEHWLCAKKISKGTITLQFEEIKEPYDETKANEYADVNIQNPQDYTFLTKYEIPTGSVENFKLKNIYDLSGNMWEWTTEVGKRGTTSGSFAVLRGGSFYHYGVPDEYPLCYRGGDRSTAYTHVSVGFRVVLYINPANE